MRMCAQLWLRPFHGLNRTAMRPMWDNGNIPMHTLCNHFILWEMQMSWLCSHDNASSIGLPRITNHLGKAHMKECARELPSHHLSISCTGMGGREGQVPYSRGTLSQSAGQSHNPAECWGAYALATLTQTFGSYTCIDIP